MLVAVTLTIYQTNDAVDELATLKFWTDTDKANQQIEKHVSQVCHIDGVLNLTMI